MISGHRRKLALEILGIDKVLVEIKKLSYDGATIFMVDSNMYREKILPSEKAFTYKMKIDAIKHQCKKLICTRKVSKSSILVGKENKDSREKSKKIY